MTRVFVTATSDRRGKDLLDTEDTDLFRCKQATRKVNTYAPWSARYNFTDVRRFAERDDTFPFRLFRLSFRVDNNYDYRAARPTSKRHGPCANSVERFLRPLLIVYS